MAATECIIQRTAGYTVMSNYHLRDKRLSLKAKGLLSVILSLPEGWDYTISGLAVICDVGKDTIRGTLTELEKTGYINRKRLKVEGGKFGGNQYIIREVPVDVQQPLSDFPTMDNPTMDNPTMDNPTMENPSLENPTEIITDQSITDEMTTPVSPDGTEPPKEPEAKQPRKRRKKSEAPQSYELDDIQMEALIRQNVATLGKSNGWTKDGVNAVYKLVMEFYAPRAVNGKPPTHTARGVNGLFRKLAPDGKCTTWTAAEMLLEAIERGWTSVYPRGELKAPPSALPSCQKDMGEEW